MPLVLALHLFPNLAPYADVKLHGFAGLSALGWLAFMVMWVLQAFVFWHGMEAIRKFIDWAGPGVYVVMAILCGWLVWKAEGELQQRALGNTERSDEGLGALVAGARQR